MRDAIHSLAVAVVSQKTVKTPFRVEWLNSSSLPESASRALEDGFVAQLSVVRGLLGNDPSLPSLRVHFTDTPSQLVVTAQIPSSSGPEVRLIRINRGNLVSRAESTKLPSARRQLLLAQREPVLDAAEWRDSSGQLLLLVLTARAFAAYEEAELLTPRASAELPGPPISRDLRGSIGFGNSAESTFRLHLSGEFCTAAMGESISLVCSPSGRPGASDAVAADEPVSVHLPCDGHRWTLATDAGDRTTPDRLLLTGEQPGSASVPLFEFAGPLTSLSAGDRGTLVAVTFNLSSGEYEVYRITLGCRD